MLLRCVWFLELHLLHCFGSTNGFRIFVNQTTWQAIASITVRRNFQLNSNLGPDGGPSGT